jgi:hypothetical protein
MASLTKALNDQEVVADMRLAYDWLLGASGGMYDDFCIDDEKGVAYVTDHCGNKIDRVPLEPGGDAVRAIAGEPLDLLLLGPTSLAWGRMPGEYGRVAYVTTDGDNVAPPPDGKVRTAKLLRIDIQN